MNYTKPEVAVLGPASLVIQGTINEKLPEQVSPFETFDAADCELDD